MTVDSKDRTIYIHGTTMEWKLGFPSTIGCIHMRSIDVAKLFDEVSVGTLVFITT
jgi:lipoprotein-anchoring transpeptidase ErfK/SrfK